MTVTVYRSSDANAPVLSGTAGALVGVLDACLVNGYTGKSAAGWAIAYTGTNIRSYRPGSGQGDRLYLGVDDTGTQSARVRGFQSMTAAGVAVASGTNPFPTDTQVSGGLYTYKSNAASSAARAWVLITNGNIFYMWIDSQADGVAGTWLAFGTPTSYKSGDTNCTILIASTSAANTTNNFSMFSANIASVLTGHYLSQKYDGVTYSVGAGKTPIFGGHYGITQMGGAGLLQYPDPLQGGLLFTPVYLIELSGTYGVLRGRLPGVWAPCHPTIFITGDVIVGDAGDLNGKTLESFRCYGAGAACNVFIETSDTWEAINFR